jgi:hypothetical protein
MSTRDREPEPGPLRYAPKWARTVGSEEAAKRNRPRRPPAESVPPQAVPGPTRASPPPPSRDPPPSRQGRKPRGAFEGDVAIRELRGRMALAPDLPPSPPLRAERGAALGIVFRLTGLVLLAAIVACAFVWISTPRPQDTVDASPAFQDLAGGPEPVATGEEPGGMSPAVFMPTVSPSGAEPGGLRASEKAFPADPQRLPTGPWPLPDRRGEGAPSPVSPSAGGPSPAAGPPRPAPPPGVSVVSPGLDREQVAVLIARGQTYFANGDIVSARLMLRRAAETGDPQAALALGGTYDPLILKSLGVIGVAADAAQARSWYQKAAELGSREAPQRLDQLAQWTQ